MTLKRIAAGAAVFAALGAASVGVGTGVAAADHDDWFIPVPPPGHIGQWVGIPPGHIGQWVGVPPGHWGK